MTLSRRSRTKIRKSTLRDSETVCANRQDLSLNQSSKKPESTYSRPLLIPLFAFTQQPPVSTQDTPAKREYRVMKERLLTTHAVRLPYCNSALGATDLQPASLRPVPHGSRWTRGGPAAVHAPLRVGGSPSPDPAADGSGLMGSFDGWPFTGPRDTTCRSGDFHAVSLIEMK